MSVLLPADVAEDLHLSVYTATEHIREGRIKGGFRIVPGGPWRVDAEVYEAWKAERVAASDPNRIDGRSARSKAAQERRTA